MNYGYAFGGGYAGKGGKAGNNRLKIAAAACSQETYLDSSLRMEDLEAFSAAALVPYRKVEAGIELLLTSEKPWNIFTRAYDPVSHHVLGGKRIMSREWIAETTAIRCFAEALEGVPDVPSNEAMLELMSKSFAMWYPTGRFGIVFFEATDGFFSDLPEKFAEAKKSKSSEEFTINADGVKKWTRQIEALEWVQADQLAPELKRACSDLMQNVLRCQSVQDFLSGSLDPLVVYPPAEQAAVRAQRAGEKAVKGGKDGLQGWKGGGRDRKAKGGKGWAGKGKEAAYFPSSYKGGSGYTMPMDLFRMPPMPPPAGLPMLPMQVNGQMHQVQMNSQMHQMPDGEMQNQMFGEQLYVLIQPLVPSAYHAQKITGMLLELPHKELMTNLTNAEERQRRVAEALQLIEEEGG